MEFARQLADQCETLVLVARRTEPMEALASELRAEYPALSVGVLAADLTRPEDRRDLLDQLQTARLQPDLLVNNAGMGDYGEFVDSDWDKVEAMIRLNVEALTAMTHALVPAMVAGGGGSVIQVSSLASLLPIPDFAVYAATKAYVTSFSEALRLELREHGIRMTALCPGPVHTGFGQIARREQGSSESPLREAFYVNASQVVAEALAGLSENRPRVFPGIKIALAAAAIGLVPLALLRLAMGTRPRRQG